MKNENEIIAGISKALMKFNEINQKKCILNGKSYLLIDVVDWWAIDSRSVVKIYVNDEHIILTIDEITPFLDLCIKGDSNHQLLLDQTKRVLSKFENARLLRKPYGHHLSIENSIRIDPDLSEDFFSSVVEQFMRFLKEIAVINKRAKIASTHNE